MLQNLRSKIHKFLLSKVFYRLDEGCKGGHSIITFALRGEGEGVHQNVNVCNKYLVHKQLAIIARFFISVLKVPLLVKIYVLNRYGLRFLQQFL